MYIKAGKWEEAYALASKHMPSHEIQMLYLKNAQK